MAVRDGSRGAKRKGRRAASAGEGVLGWTGPLTSREGRAGIIARRAALVGVVVFFTLQLAR